MAPTKNKSTPNNRVRSNFKMGSFVKRYANVDFLKELLIDPGNLHVTCYALIVLELLLNVFIVQRINYTEIDWIAYMQEVEGFINGTLDYKELKGNTGPLVYPAGFVYVYSLLYYVTSSGQNVRLAQYIFLILYICQLYVVFEIYCKTKKVPPYALILTTLTSYRIHSIYVLRLFNDPIAVFLFYVALSCFIKRKWIVGSAFYSLAVSVKMNILLYAPCLLIAYLTNLTFYQTFLNLIVCTSIQLILGAPFLYANFWSYVKGSFDFGRVFEHKWTVNYRFLDVETFESRYFHAGLLILHVCLLLAFAPSIYKYLKSYSALHRTVDDLKKQTGQKQRKQQAKRRERKGKSETVEIDFSTVATLIVLPFFVTNFIGVACARSLHYQFYSWYFHSLLYLAFCTPYRKPIAFLILAVIEFCWNAYPSTVTSSALLHVCHVLILYGVYKVMNDK